MSAVGITVSKDTAIRALLRIPLPHRPVPTVAGIDDFALRRSHDYATIVMNADTGQRIEMLPGRSGQVVTDWVRKNPGITTVCRGRSAAYAQAIREALPDALQVTDRWHLWHGLAEAAGKEIDAHSACWATVTGLQDGPRAYMTAARWKQVHDLIDHGVGLLDCSRRLSLSLNTVKRYARATEPKRALRVPQYRPTLVDPYRDHLRARREQDPAIPATRLLAEIRQQGYTGSANLLVRYPNQSRHFGEHTHLSPRRTTRLMLTRPERLTTDQQQRLAQVAGACPEFAAVHRPVGALAALLRSADYNATKLDAWIQTVFAADLPHLRSFARGLQQDHAAVTAATTTPHHNGRTEGVNTRTKMIKRQMYGRAGFELLRHRILLA